MSSTGIGAAMYMDVDTIGTKLFVNGVDGLYYSTDTGTSFINYLNLNYDSENNVATMNTGAYTPYG
jgi:hypothetical protein